MSMDLQKLYDDATPGSTITVPPGAYDVYKPLQWYGKRGYVSAYGAKLIGHNISPVVRMGGKYQIGLGGLTINGNGGDGLVVENTGNLSMRDVWIEYARNGLVVRSVLNASYYDLMLTQCRTGILGESGCMNIANFYSPVISAPAGASTAIDMRVPGYGWTFHGGCFECPGNAAVCLVRTAAQWRMKFVDCGFELGPLMTLAAEPSSTISVIRPTGNRGKNQPWPAGEPWFRLEV